MTSEQVVQWAKEAEKLANAACKEMPGMEYRAAEAFALITLARADLEAELESLRKDAERYRWLREYLSTKDVYIVKSRSVAPDETAEYTDEAIDSAIAAAPAMAHSAMKGK